MPPVKSVYCISSTTLPEFTMLSSHLFIIPGSCKCLYQLLYVYLPHYCPLPCGATVPSSFIMSVLKVPLLVVLTI